MSSDCVRSNAQHVVRSLLNNARLSDSCLRVGSGDEKHALSLRARPRSAALACAALTSPLTSPRAAPAARQQDRSNHIVHEFFKSSHFNDGIPVVPGALEALQRLSEHCDLVVVTSRQHVIQDVTLSWIDRHYAGLFREVYFGNHFALQVRTALPWQLTRGRWPSAPCYVWGMHCCCCRGLALLGAFPRGLLSQPMRAAGGNGMQACDPAVMDVLLVLNQPALLVF